MNVKSTEFPFYAYQQEDIERAYVALTESLYQGTSARIPLRSYLNYSEMGTGKTAVAWGVLDKLLLAGKLDGPVLIVGPSQCLHVWTENPLYTTSFLRRFCIHSADTELTTTSIVRVSYSALRAAHRRHTNTNTTQQQQEEMLFTTEFSVVVFDEVHALKNNASKTSVAAAALKRVYSLGLSGTPIMNGGAELFSIMRNALQLDRVDYPSIKRFPKSNYAIALLSLFSHGRKKSDLDMSLSSTAPIIDTVRCIDTKEAIAWTNRQAMEYYVQTKRAALGQFDHLSSRHGGPRQSAHILASIQRLRGCCLFPTPEDIPWVPGNRERVDPAVFTLLLCIRRQHPQVYSNIGAKLALVGAVVPAFRVSDKMQRCMELIHETATGKVVVVSAFRQFLEHCMTPYCKRNGIGTRLFAGGNKTTQKKALFDFQHDDSIKVLLLVKQAGALGLNLQHCASTCIIMDPHYNRALDDQAAQRIHRIGQTRDVRIVRLYMSGSIEELMLRMQAEKSKEVGAWFNHNKKASDVAMFQRCGLFLRERDTVTL